jgi:hypothetical protein
MLALGLTSGCAGFRRPMGGTAQNDHNVLTGGSMVDTSLNELPPPVRETLRRNVPKAEIADIDKQENDGRVSYKISFSHPGTNGSVIISEEGKILTPSEAPVGAKPRRKDRK